MSRSPRTQGEVRRIQLFGCRWCGSRGPAPSRCYCWGCIDTGNSKSSDLLYQVLFLQAHPVLNFIRHFAMRSIEFNGGGDDPNEQCTRCDEESKERYDCCEWRVGRCRQRDNKHTGDKDRNGHANSHHSITDQLMPSQHIGELCGLWNILTPAHTPPPAAPPRLSAAPSPARRERPPFFTILGLQFRILLFRSLANNYFIYPAGHRAVANSGIKKTLS